MKLLKTEEVAKKLNISRDHFRKFIKHQPTFPKPVKLTPKGHPMWIDTAIDEYLKKAA